MFAISIIILVLASIYAALMMTYRMGWERQSGFAINPTYQPKTSISIIIPARNEELNIANCINAILQQNYPAHLFEIIVVDDHSEDNTKSIVAGFRNKNVHCISLSEHLSETETIAYKKAALNAGIAISKGLLIVTTDADCLASADWLRHLAAKYEYYQPAMIIAPVDYTDDKTLLNIFQSIDFMSMQGITAATHELNMGNMCNGANLAFTKEAYYAVNGYEGIDHLASGDDYLLMMKISNAFPGKVAYLKSKEAIVKTAAQINLKGFLQQRIRWASKSGKYDDKLMTLTLILVYLFNCSFLVLAVMSLFSAQAILLSGSLLLLKIIAELIFLFPVARFFGKRNQLLFFPFLQPFHIAYIVVAGFMGFVGVYKWKGRTVR